MQKGGGGGGEGGRNGARRASKGGPGFVYTRLKVTLFPTLVEVEKQTSISVPDRYTSTAVYC